MARACTTSPLAAIFVPPSPSDAATKDKLPFREFSAVVGGGIGSRRRVIAWCSRARLTEIHRPKTQRTTKTAAAAIIASISAVPSRGADGDGSGLAVPVRAGSVPGVEVLGGVIAPPLEERAKRSAFTKDLQGLTC